MSSQPTGLEISNLTVRRGGRVVLEDISLTIREQRVGIIGRNGSGKSTFARALAGLQKPEQGSVRIDGIDPLRDRRGVLDRVGILFQNPDHQIFMPTVIEELTFGLHQQGKSKPEALRIAQTVLQEHGRADWQDRPVAMLSEGQRRYLCLMAVLAMGPGTILLDEPFAGLDLPTSWHLESWLDKLSQRLILISHDPRNLTNFDRVIWLEEGRIAADGPAGEIMNSYLDAMKRLAGTGC